MSGQHRFGQGFELVPCLVGVEGDVDTLRETVIVLEGGIRASEAIGREDNLVELAHAPIAEVGGSLLETVEEQAGVPVVDALVGDSEHDFVEADLDSVHVLREWEIEREVLTGTAGAGGLEAAAAQVEVEIAVVTAAECRRFAEEAVFTEMMTDTSRHGALQKK